MSEEITAGSPVTESVNTTADGVDVDAIFAKPSVTDWLNAEESTTSTEPIATEEEQVVAAPAIDEAEAKRREEQSWKDKYYAEAQKRAELAELALSKVGTPQQAAQTASEEDDIEAAIRAEYGEEPVLLGLAKELKSVKQQLQQQTSQVVQKTAQTVYSTIEQFVTANKAMLENPEIGNVFFDEINDRLPSGDFGALVKAAQEGKQFDPEFVPVLAKKLEKALAVATGKGVVDTQRANASTQKANSRASAPPAGIQPKPQAVIPTTAPKPMSYNEALAACRAGRV